MQSDTGSRRRWRVRSLSRRSVLITVGAVLATLLLIRLAAVFVFERSWFSSIGASEAFGTAWFAKVICGLFGIALYGVGVGTVVWLSSRQRFDTRHNLVAEWWDRRYRRLSVPVVVGGVAWATYKYGLGFVGHWQKFVLFFNGEPVGVKDAAFDRDIGVYLFSLPIRAAVADAVILAALLGFIAVLAISCVNGGVVLEGVIPRRVRPLAGRLLWATGSIGAASYGLRLIFVDRLRLATSAGSDGALGGYTDRTIANPALVIAGILCVVAVPGIYWLVRTNRWRAVSVAAPTAIIVVMLLVSVVPSGIDRLFVSTDRSHLDADYFAANREATVEAFDIGDVTSGELMAGAPAETPTLDASLTRSTFQTLGGDQNLDTSPVSIYSTPDAVAQAVGARIPDSRLIGSGWEDARLAYTHGQGVMQASASRTDAEGRPVLDIVDTADDAIYFGEGLNGWYVVANTDRNEFLGRGFDGRAPLVGSFGARTIAALALGDIRLWLTDQTRSDSAVLYRRGLDERVRAVAPFLSSTDTPQAVLTDDGLVWVSTYATTSTTYPQASSFAFSGSGSPAKVNYLRPSVRATLDSKTGEFHLYRVDGLKDPLLDAWTRAMPGLIEDASRLDAAVADQLLYPSSVFSTQAATIGVFHTDDTNALAAESATWTVAADPGNGVGASSKGPVSPALVADLGSDGQPRLTKQLSLVPGGSSSTRARLAAIVTVSQDPQDFGEIRLTPLLRANTRYLGPLAVQRTIESDTNISWGLTQLDQAGSAIRFGQVQYQRIDDRLVALRPIFVSGKGDDTFARLLAVAAVDQGKAVVAPNATLAVQATTDPAIEAQYGSLLGVPGSGTPPG